MPRIDPERRRALVADARVGRLATVTAEGEPHVVPCCFVLAGDPGIRDTLYTAVDAKPKSTLALKRLDNVAARPTASLVVDHYDDDWSRLWWVRVDGAAGVVDGAEERAAALSMLAEKYEQYRATTPPGPVVRMRIDRWADWTAVEL